MVSIRIDPDLEILTKVWKHYQKSGIFTKIRKILPKIGIRNYYQKYGLGNITNNREQKILPKLWKYYQTIWI